MVDGLHRLGHDAVVGGHHQDGHVGNHGAAGPHGGKGFVAGGVQEGDGIALHVHLVGADVLGDAAGFAGHHVGVSDIVQKGGLAVVHVAHNYHHGSPGLQVLLPVLGGVDKALLDGDNHLFFHLTAHLLGDDGGGVEVDNVGEGGHNPVFNEALHHLGPGLFHPGGQLTHTDLVGDEHLGGGLLGNLQLEAAHPVLLLLAALVAEGLAPAALLAAPLVLLLELLLAPPHVLAALVSEVLQPLVILLQVHRRAATGVHHLLGGDAAGRLLDRGLALLLGLGLGRGPGALALSGLGLVLLLPMGSGRTALRLGCGLLFGLGLVVDVGIDLFDGVDLVMLGQILKDNRQLQVGQGLHVVLGGVTVLGQDVHDLLGGQGLPLLGKVLGQLMDGIFNHHRCMHLVSQGLRNLPVRRRPPGPLLADVGRSAREPS